MTQRILAVDDDSVMAEMVEAALQTCGFETRSATSLAEAVDLLETDTFDAVVTDLHLENGSGLDLCDRVRAIQPDVPVIVLTGHGNMSAAIGAIRAGAYDFITKPVEMEVLTVAVKRAVEHREVKAEVKRLEQRLTAHDAAGELVGKSAPMQKVYELIRRVRDTAASVLVAGESGTGKELVARALHRGTTRETKSFVAINCAAVPATLLESELFGHTRGAFTDARAARMGLFQQASGGTLFLDEISEMPVEMQAKLLRVLQERTVRPVGSNVEIPIDARIVAATNRDLEQEVEEGRFREDLYYRLNVVQINIPPLRARGNDILMLAQHFVEKGSERVEREVRGLSGEVGERLLAYDWPGNVRQLQNCMERAVTLTRFDHVTVDDLPEKVRCYAQSPGSTVEADPEHILPLDVLERRYIEKVLSSCGGNKSQAARLLGLDRRTLYRKLDRYEGNIPESDGKALSS